MDYFYDGQIRRYVTQFIRVMSNFSYKDGKGNLIQIPVKYGDLSRQTAQVLKKGSENVLSSAPFIACYIKDFRYDRSRLQDPTYVSKVNIREREVDGAGNYLNTQGKNYTVERIMPSPYNITFAADIWTTNSDQKFQIVEQIACIFNPALDLQTTDNYIDWTSLSMLSLTDQGQWSTRTVPQGLDENLEIASMVFEAPVWITPPAKVKQMNIITKIINNVFASVGTEIEDLRAGYAAQIFNEPDEKVVITPNNFNLLVLNGTAKLESESYIFQGDDINQPSISWLSILDRYPGKFIAGLSQIRLTTPSGTEIVAFISLNANDESQMMLVFDRDSIPGNTVISGRGTVDAIINPDTFNPTNKVVNTRYLILENIHSTSQDGPAAWLQGNGNGFSANANDIIEWNGTVWSVIFSSTTVDDLTYITNSYTGVQYKWDGVSWSKSFEGVYNNWSWRLVL